MMPKGFTHFVALMLLLLAPALLASCQKIAGWMTQWSGAQPAPSPSSSTEVKEVKNEVANLSKRNGEILQEIYRVVWVIHPQSPAEFGNWLDSINQGASFEGVYNAFTRSLGQMNREADSRSIATPGALKTFANLMAGLALEFPEVPKWRTEDAQPLSQIRPDEESSDSGMNPRKPEVIEFAPLAKPDPKPSDRPTQEALAADLIKRFNGASIFTLKRVLGDLGLRVIEMRKAESQERLWDWFSDFAVSTSRLKVDFGIPQRNSTDKAFHRLWASQSSDDVLRWEVLNRLHRLLNESQPLKLP